jgi:hypothetical protein
MTSKTNRAGNTICLLGATIGLFLLAGALYAQGNFGRILGAVTDQTGAVLPGAVVTVIDTQRGIARSLVTDSAGVYDAPNLVPSTYTVKVEMKGFKVLDRPNIVLEVGREIRVDLTPQPGEQSQTVIVEATAPLVDAASAKDIGSRAAWIFVHWTAKSRPPQFAHASGNRILYSLIERTLPFRNTRFARHLLMTDTLTLFNTSVASLTSQ